MLNNWTKYIIFLFVFTLILIPSPIFAIVDPNNSPNNKYGIHIIDENDIEKASQLVNSSGGDWGYVTIVMTEKGRDLKKWQSIFDRMRELHLIPIVRLATELVKDTWKAPKLQDANGWAEFLNSLKWVIKNRYVVIFNEPNHAKEWGGSINPRQYAETLVTFSSAFKNKSPDFFILPAALDSSAPNTITTMDERKFLYSMLIYQPDLLTYIDGWNSHSYPNPGFTGKAEARGKGSLSTFQWEVKFLKSLAETKKLPVFITETGWPHQEGEVYNRNYYSAKKVANLVKKANKIAWSDPRIVAITPFVLNYQSFPFSNFSWQKPNIEDFYPQYEVYRAIPKVAGDPVRKKDWEIFLNNLAFNLEKSSPSKFRILSKPFYQPPFLKRFFWFLRKPSFTSRGLAEVVEVARLQ